MKMKTILFGLSCVILLFSYANQVSASIDTLNLKSYGIFSNDDIEDATRLNGLIKEHTSDSLIIKFEGGKYRFGFQVKTDFNHYVKWMGETNTEVYPTKDFQGYSLISGYNLDLFKITVNGMDRIERGIVINKNCRIIDSKIINFNSPESKMSRGLVYGELGNSLYVSNTQFKNIGGLEDGKIGNGVGSHRAIVLNGRNVVIDSCTFENIHGVEDGDIIHIHSFIDSKGKWGSSGQILIKNCTFKEFGKRAIKVQAAGVHIINCRFVSSEESSVNGPRNVIALMGPNNVIEGCNINVKAISHAIIVKSDSNIIENNVIWVHNKITSSKVRGSMIHGIKIYGNYNTVKRNTIRFNSLGVPIQIKKGQENVITKNSVEYVKSSILSDKENNKVLNNATHRVAY